jgi:histidinol-phosphate aminotransferase
MQKALLPFSVSSLQAALVETVLEEPGFAARYVTEAMAERDRVAAALTRLAGVDVFPSVTNFLLFRVDDAERAFESLLAEGILVRRQDHLPGLERCLRVSMGTPAENDAFVEALSAYVSGAQRASEVSHAAG